MLSTGLNRWCFKSPATVPENMLDTCRSHVRWETPRGRYDECSSKFSLSMNQGYRTVGDKSASEGVNGACWLGTCTQHNQIIFPNLTVRLSISLACWKQRIRRIVWKMMFVCIECKRTILAVNCITWCKVMDQGPQFTSGVYLPSGNQGTTGLPATTLDTMKKFLLRTRRLVWRAPRGPRPREGR